MDDDDDGCFFATRKMLNNINKIHNREGKKQNKNKTKGIEIERKRGANKNEWSCLSGEVGGR